MRPLRPLAIALVSSSLAVPSAAQIARVDPAVALAPQELPGPGPLDRTSEITRLLPKIAAIPAEVNACVTANMADFDTPGASVAVMHGGDLLYEHGYGVLHAYNGSPTRADSVFRIGSITKMMVAASVMQLVEQGLVDLDAPVTEYVPDLAVAGPWPASSITVRNTLTHTTSFPDVIRHIIGTGPASLEGWAARQGDMSLYAAPRSFWNYSNPNFMLAGLVAQNASGVDYRSLLRDRLWLPAGMDHTTFDATAVAAAGNFAYGHTWSESLNRWVTTHPQAVDSWAAGPAGWALSTARDLVRWADLLMTDGGPVLSRRSILEMQRPQVWMNLRPDLFYAFGIMAETYKGLDVRQHGGNISGWGSYLLWIPQERLAVAVLANAPQSLIDATYCIVDAVLDLPPAGAPPDYSTDPSTWSKYRGTYDVREAATGYTWSAEVFVDDDRLWATVSGPTIPEPDGITVELFQVYPETFVVDEDGDGHADIDLSFVAGHGDPPRVEFVRNRHSVGTRRADPRHVVDRRPAAP
jgi:CubicO group peptidase (beta-lactamase class C family)